MNIRELEHQDESDLLKWRNDLLIRKACFNDCLISEEEHGRWFNSVMGDKNIFVYIATMSDEKIGVIRFENKNHGCYVNVNLNPIYIGRGYGHLLIKKGTEKFLLDDNGVTTISAEIKADNIVSRKSFLKAGYIIKDERVDKILMEMKK